MLTDASLKNATEALLRFKPAYIVGYSVALDRFACIARERRLDLHRLKLKAVIATAEGFPRSDSRAQIADTFGCPVVMEYGTSETGPMAYETPEGGYRVFHRYFLLEAVESQHTPGARELLITTLYPRCFPLVRYRVGDLVQPEKGQPDWGLTRFSQLIGRSNDIFHLPSGQAVHSVTLTHAIKSIAAVRCFQVVVHKTTGDITLRYEAPQPLVDADQAELKRRLAGVHPDLHAVHLQWVQAMEQTVAGKTRMVVTED